MSVRAVCPECGATTTLDAATGGKSVPCGQCGSPVTVPGKKPTGPPPLPPKPAAAMPPAPVPAAPPPPSDEPLFEVMDDEEVEELERADSDEELEPIVYDDEDDEELEEVGEADDDEEEHSIPRRRPEDAAAGGSRGGSRRFVATLTLLFCLGLFVVVGGTVAYLTWPKTDTEAEIREREDRLAEAARANRTEPVPENVEPKSDPKVEPKKTPPKVEPKTDTTPVPDVLPITPVLLEGDRKTIPLPEPIIDACAAAEGRFLLLHGATQPKLYVYDVCQMKIVKEIPTAGKDARYSAGARHLLLADNAARWFQRYDLTTLEVDLAGPYPFPGTIADMAIGAGSMGPAMVLATEPADAFPAHFVDLSTLGLAAGMKWIANPPAADLRLLVLTASANGRRWIGIPLERNGKGGLFIEHGGGRLVSHKSVNADSVLGFAALSGDGGFFFSRAGTQSWGSQVTLGTTDSDSFTLPAVTGPIAVHFKAAKQRMDGTEGMSVAVTPEQFAWPEKGWSLTIAPPYAAGESLPPDRRAFYAPKSRVLVTCPGTGEPRLELHKLNFLEAMPAKKVTIVSTPATSYHPGTRFAHRMQAEAAGPVEWKLTSDVEGPSIDPSGVIRWQVPPKQELVVGINVTATCDGQTSSQILVLTNAGPAPPKPPAIVAKPPVGPKVVAKPPEPKKENPIAVGATLVQTAAGKQPINVPKMDSPSIEVDLPGPIRDACVGGGGRFLIFHCPTARKLAIFDVNTLKVEKTLTLNVDEVLFAAGMDKLFVVYPDEKLVIRYSLSTFKLEADTTLEFLQKPTAAAMGSATDGPLILGGIPSQKNASKMALAFLDTATMKEVKIDKVEGDFGVTFNAAASLRASADGRTLGAWLTRLDPSGLQVARLNGNTITGSHKAESVGYVSPSSDGRNVFTNRGVFNAETLGPGLTVPGVPSVQGNGYLTIETDVTGGQSVKLTLQDSPMGTFRDLPGFDGKRDPFDRDNPSLTLDRRLFYVPDAKILAVIPPAANKLHIRRVGDGK